MKYTADFETTTKVEDCRVWAWAVCEIADGFRTEVGNNLDDFIWKLSEGKGDSYYFHNLKFDGESIMYWLFTHGWTHILDKAEAAAKTFTTLISDSGLFYSMTLYFDMKANGKPKHYVTIYDSLKIIPFGVEKVAKSFNLPISKLEIDYDEEREPGHILTEQENAYVQSDVKIMAMALKVLFDEGLNKMTQGANALSDFKNIFGEDNFKRFFRFCRMRLTEIFEPLTVVDSVM